MLAVVPSLRAVDVSALRDKLAYYRNVIAALPFSDRHRRRLRARFEEMLADAECRAGYVIEAAPQDDDDDDAGFHMVVDGAAALTELEASGLVANGEARIPPLLVRGFNLARRLCPGLSPDDAMAAALKAETEVFSAGCDGRHYDDGKEDTTYEYKIEDPEGVDADVLHLARAIADLAADPGTELSLMIDEPHHLVCRVFARDGKVQADLPPNRKLPRGAKITREQHARLVELKWSAPGSSSGCFFRQWRCAYAGWWEVAEELVHDLREVFVLDPETLLDMVMTSYARCG
jgi:hypothetical protein